ncbi:ADP-heptose synthase [Brevibacillus sp. B_LB10_24]|uniref:ADP-heptose synthase n=1 Tax=Brevibacillus sp. B_LB10_24 TaxID=3380645 RepID=UPI0038B7C2B5
MRKQFVLEAVMLAIYGELMSPDHPVEYIIPSSTIYELEEIRHSPEPIMLNPEDDRHVREVMDTMIKYFDEPFTRKQMEKALVAPWSTITIPFQEMVHLTVIKAEDNEMWGEAFDPIETQLMLSAIRLQVPLLTDQIEWQDRMIEHNVALQFYDVEDFQFAVEQGINLEDLRGN